MKIGELFNPNITFDGVKIPYAISRNPDLSSSAKLCYGQLARYAGEKGFCYPSQNTLSRELGISERQIRNILKELESGGFIILIAPTGIERVKHFHNNYVFPWHPFFEDQIKMNISYTECKKLTYGPENDFRSGAERFSGPSKELKDLNLKSKEPESLSSKELRSFSHKDSSVSPEAGETGMNGLSLNSTPPLIKRKINSPIVFEKPPRQQYRKETLDIINYWNSSPGLPHHHIPPINGQGYGFPTKTFLNIVSTIEKVLDGEFFIGEGLTDNKKYSKEEIISGIDKYKLMATNLDYQPINKSFFKNLGLATFFYNRFASLIKSQFLYCLENEPKPVTSVVKSEKEKNPQTTIWLKEIYIDKVLLGIPKKLTRLEENQFIRGANRLFDIPRQLNPRLNLLTGPREWVEIFINALIDHWKMDKMQIGRVCSDHSFSIVLPQYLHKKGRIEPESFSSKGIHPYQKDRG